jgi:hypothetical protein
MRTLRIVGQVLVSFSMMWGQTKTPNEIQLFQIPATNEMIRPLVDVALGYKDPFVALPEVIRMGDRAVPVLEGLLTDPAFCKPSSKNDTLRSCGILAVSALEAIGTQAAYNVLVQTVQMHPDTDVRASALKALAVTYHGSDQLEKFVPDKDILHLFLQCVDDTTQGALQSKCLGGIARDGLINWLGRDFGEPRGMSTMVVNPSTASASTAGKITTVESHESWWQTHAGNIVWNSSSGCFIEK